MNPTDKICKYLTLGEVTRSANAKRLGISNMPSPEHLENMKALGVNIFDKVREHIGCPLGLSSGYRSKELNDATPGASSKSQHSLGEAFDMDADVHGGTTNKVIFDFIRLNLDFDQLIWEYGTDKEPDWVHASFKRNGGNRKTILRCTKVNGKPHYETWK